MSQSGPLVQVLIAFSDARRHMPEHDGVAVALSDVVHAAMTGLLIRLEAAQTDSEPPPLVLFGGTFQCHPVSNPLESNHASGDIPADRLAYEAGVLFSHALKAWNASDGQHAETEAIATGIDRLADQLISQAPGLENRARARVTAVRDAARCLDAIASQHQEAESQLKIKQDENDAVLARLRQLREECHAIEDTISQRSAEEKQLDDRILELRSRSKPIEELRRECEELAKSVSAGEKELAVLQKKKGELSRRQHNSEQQMVDTRKLIGQIDSRLDTTTVEKIKEIWAQLSPDEFDREFGEA